MTLKLNKYFYTSKAILETIEAFKNMTESSLESDENYYVVKIRKTTGVDDSVLKGEFLNHCFILSKKEIKPHNFWNYIYEKT